MSSLVSGQEADQIDPGKIQDSHDDNGNLRIQFGIRFVDFQDSLRVASMMNQQSTNTIRLLVESPVLYESVRPFLEALQMVDPVLLPLGDHIRHGGESTKIKLPAYSTRPGFQWDLKVLLKENAEIDELSMDPKSRGSIESARQALHIHGKLDPRLVLSDHFGWPRLMISQTECRSARR